MLVVWLIFPVIIFVTLGLLIKETQTIKEGGYYHVHSVVDTETFKKRDREGIEEYEKNMSS